MVRNWSIPENQYDFVVVVPCLRFTGSEFFHAWEIGRDQDVLKEIKRVSFLVFRV